MTRSAADALTVTLGLEANDVRLLRSSSDIVASYLSPPTVARLNPSRIGQFGDEEMDR